MLHNLHWNVQIVMKVSHQNVLQIEAWPTFINIFLFVWHNSFHKLWLVEKLGWWKFYSVVSGLVFTFKLMMDLWLWQTGALVNVIILFLFNWNYSKIPQNYYRIKLKFSKLIYDHNSDQQTHHPFIIAVILLQIKKTIG